MNFVMEQVFGVVVYPDMTNEKYDYIAQVIKKTVMGETNEAEIG